MHGDEDQDGNELIQTLEHHDVGTDTPDLTLPAVCNPKPGAYRRSSFQLGVQKAVQGEFFDDDRNQTGSFANCPIV